MDDPSPSLLLLLALPVALIDLGGKIGALVSLSRAEKVRGGSKPLWAVIILLVNGFGWIAWFLFGREEP